MGNLRAKYFKFLSHWVSTWVAKDRAGTCHRVHWGSNEHLHKCEDLERRSSPEEHTQLTPTPHLHMETSTLPINSLLHSLNGPFH